MSRPAEDRDLHQKMATVVVATELAKSYGETTMAMPGSKEKMHARADAVVQEAVRSIEGEPSQTTKLIRDKVEAMGQALQALEALGYIVTKGREMESKPSRN